RSTSAWRMAPSKTSGSRVRRRTSADETQTTLDAADGHGVRLHRLDAGGLLRELAVGSSERTAGHAGAGTRQIDCTSRQPCAPTGCEVLRHVPPRADTDC